MPHGAPPPASQDELAPARLAPELVLLAAAWAFLIAAPLGLAALDPAPVPLPAALSAALHLALLLLPAALARRAPELPAQGLPAQGLPALGLLVGASLPALALAAPWSAAVPAGAALGALYALLALLGALATARAGAGRSLAAAWLLVCGALPLGLQARQDLLGVGPGEVAWLSPPLALQRLLAGEPAGPAFLGLLGLVAAGVAVGVVAGRAARRGVTRGRTALLAAALVAGGLLLGPPARGQPAAEELEPLLGARVRPNEPWPVRLRARGLQGAPALAARSFGLRVALPLGEGQPGELPGLPQGGGWRIELEAGAPGGAWEPLQAALPRPEPVSEHELLVGCLGEGARALAATLLGGERAALVELGREGLPLLARAGEALDLVVGGGEVARDPAAAACLRAWAAQGGVLVLDDPRDLPRVGGADDAAPGRPRGPLRARPLGTGLLLGAAGEAPLAAGLPALTAALDPALRAALGQRLERRARREALTRAVLALVRPAPDAALARPLALGALLAALALAALAPLARRVEPPTAAGGALLLGTALALLLGAALGPPAPVMAAGQEVLELPAGGRVAHRLAWVACAAPRALPAELRLGPTPAGPPRPVFESAQAALRARAELVLEPAGPRLLLPLAPAPRTFLRGDAIRLDGPLLVERGAGGVVRLENRSGLALEDAWAVAAGGVRALGALPPGAALELDLARGLLPWERWRLAGETPEEAGWRRLVTAALAGRDPGAGLLLVARVAPGAPLVADGAAAERRAPGLLVLDATEPAGP